MGPRPSSRLGPAQSHLLVEQGPGNRGAGETGPEERALREKEVSHGVYALWVQTAAVVITWVRLFWSDGRSLIQSCG
jgi:hypothetical protein